MFKLSIFLVCVFVSLVRSQSENATTVDPIILMENVMEPNGSFHYKYETADGIKFEEEGSLKESDNEVVEIVRGRYEYPGPDGKPVSIQYYADETGYHPSGDSIPVVKALSATVIKHEEPVTET